MFPLNALMMFCYMSVQSLFISSLVITVLIRAGQPVHKVHIILIPGQPVHKVHIILIPGQRGEEGQPQQFIVRATFSLFSRPSYLGILVLVFKRFQFSKIKLF